jgi:hypothetical protein
MDKGPLQVTAASGTWWRFKYCFYCFEGMGKLISLGTYPEVALADARDKRADARKQAAAGPAPGEIRKAQKQAMIAVAENSFEVVAREWHEKFKQ